MGTAHVKRLLGFFLGAFVATSRSSLAQAASIATSSCPLVAISAGNDVTLALGADGRVIGSGRNEGSQLGNPRAGAFSNLLVPAEGLTSVEKISAGGFHELAVLVDGALWGWGLNEQGQLGIGPAPPWYYLVPIPLTMSDVSAVSAGATHSLAVDPSGQAWAWGENMFGEVGDGTTITRDMPQPVIGLGSVTAVSAGYWLSLALAADGTVWAWGFNSSGQLGNGTISPSSRPVQVLNLSQVTAISAGASHSLALTADGSLWAWGTNGEGELGIGWFSPGEVVPIRLTGISGVRAIAGGGFHSLALRDDGTVWTWGHNVRGQLGLGTSGVGTEENTPRQVPSLSNVIAISAGAYHSLALDASGVLWAWGDNQSGQLGIGRNGIGDLSNTPVPVLLDAPPRDLGNLLRAVRAGDDVVLDFGGALWLAGYRIYSDGDKRNIGVTALPPDAATRGFVDGGAILRSDPQYYQVRGLSLCSATPGAP